ncbi:hypothetical protein PV08_10909 [Exophiala spinifera]|uniref:Zn(2)-C6 fungal-type domain-containing protein n=1 Tax=Exophiala spinifera TaxID=91928 RepID=A0A0D1ZF54_9EURO|nr:uncharacterized protein PV08_10909 [Exophiala spinifera]KIW11607.1 hypothetical protein PV08_10909 [Exophiala spinifera]
MAETRVKAAPVRAGFAQACDARRRRKVRCDRSEHCKNCVHAGLPCVYSDRKDAARSRMSIVRGGVIAMCKTAKDQQRHASVTSIRTNSTSTSTQALLSMFPKTYFLDLINDYYTYVFPTVPVIGREEFRQAIRNMACSNHDTALVFCLAAQTIYLSRAFSSRPPVTKDDVRTLFEMTLRAREPLLSVQQITSASVLVSLLVSTGMIDTFKDQAMGTYYNREAIAGLQALRVDDSEHQSSLEPQVAAQRERLYWIVFIHDRYHSLQNDQLSNLPPLAFCTPQGLGDVPPDTDTWLDQEVRLFRVVDDDFLRFHKDKGDPRLTREWIVEKQLQLGSDAEAWIQTVQQFSELQQMDLIVTNYWLRTVLWRIALFRFPLMSNQGDAHQRILTLEYPMHLSRPLRHLLTTRSRAAVEFHGEGMLQKLFDITCTVADVLLNVLAHTWDVGTRSAQLENFVFLHAFLLGMSSLPEAKRRVLHEKMGEVQTVFPEMG